jgi:hypothetical protein
MALAVPGMNDATYTRHPRRRASVEQRLCVVRVDNMDALSMKELDQLIDRRGANSGPSLQRSDRPAAGLKVLGDVPFRAKRHEVQ